MSGEPAIDDAYAAAAAAGIHPLILDTPFGIGPVNTYLIEDDPLTLVDCGLNTGTALLQLKQQLAARGHAISDLELVIVTHQHVDHAGLAATVIAESGAELASLDRLAPLLADWPARSEASDEAAYELMLRHGVEQPVAEALRAVSNIVRGFGAAAQVTRPLPAGSAVELGDRRLKVLHRPGHSPSDTVLLDEQRGIALLGDHLLRDVSSNALVDPSLAVSSTRRPEPLLQYRESLERTRELAFTLGLTGHGAPVLDHRRLIDKRLAAHERRASHFYELLADGPRSAHELATARWGKVAVTQAFLTLSEVLGHLGLLIAEGRVREDDSGPVVRFERAG